MCGCRSGVFCGGLCAARWILICRGGGLVWAVVGKEGMGEVRTFHLLGLLRLGGLRS